MSQLSNTTNLEMLHELALQPISELPSSVRVGENYPGQSVWANFGNGLEVVYHREDVIVWGKLGQVGFVGFQDETLFSVCFDSGIVEPTSFLRWDKIRKDDGEGSSVPKRQRERIAEQLITKFSV